MALKVEQEQHEVGTMATNAPNLGLQIDFIPLSLHSAIKIHYVNVNDIKYKVDDMAASARWCCSKSRSISQRLG